MNISRNDVLNAFFDANDTETKSAKNLLKKFIAQQSRLGKDVEEIKKCCQFILLSKKNQKPKRAISAASTKLPSLIHASSIYPTSVPNVTLRLDETNARTLALLLLSNIHNKTATGPIHLTAYNRDNSITVMKWCNPEGKKAKVITKIYFGSE